MADVSVIIPCYNAATHIAEALDSVLAQTDVPREIWCVDDGSKDDTAAVVQRYVKSTRGIVQLIQQPNGGVSKARNNAINQATGEFIAFLDADDIWLPEKTAAQLALFAAHPEAAGVHSRLFNFEHNWDDRQREETERAKDDPTVKELIEHHWVTTSAAMVRRSALGDLRFDETTGHAEDMILFADVRLRGPWRMVDEMIVGKRIHPAQVTAKPWHRIWSSETRIKWCRSRKAELGEALATELEDQLSRGIVGYLEDRYWRRQLDDLPAMRDHVARLCPTVMSRSFLATRWLYPRWFYRVSDALRRS